RVTYEVDKREHQHVSYPAVIRLTKGQGDTEWAGLEDSSREARSMEPSPDSDVWGNQGPLQGPEPSSQIDNNGNPAGPEEETVTKRAGTQGEEPKQEHNESRDKGQDTKSEKKRRRRGKKKGKEEDAGEGVKNTAAVSEGPAEKGRMEGLEPETPQSGNTRATQTEPLQDQAGPRTKQPKNKCTQTEGLQDQDGPKKKRQKNKWTQTEELQETGWRTGRSKSTGTQTEGPLDQTGLQTEGPQTAGTQTEGPPSGDAGSDRAQPKPGKLKRKNKEPRTETANQTPQHAQTDPPPPTQGDTQCSTGTDSQGAGAGHEEQKQGGTEEKGGATTPGGGQIKEGAGNAKDTPPSEKGVKRKSTTDNLNLQQSANTGESRSTELEKPKEQSDQTAGKGGKATGKKETWKHPPPMEHSGTPMFTFYVYAILDRKFNYSFRSDALLVLFPDGQDTLDVTFSKGLDKQGYLIEAQFRAKMHLVKGQRIHYKFAIRKRNENIEEMAERNIFIPYNYPYNELHLYEGHIHRAQRSWSIKGFFLGFIKSKEEGILLARQAASRVLLDRIFERLERSFEENVVRLPQDLRQFQLCFGTASRREVYADVTALQSTDVSDLIVERLLQFMKRHSEGSSEKSSPGSNPLLVVLTVFQVCNICQLSLGLKGWAELCCLATSNTVLDSQNLKEMKKIYPNLQFTVIGLINRCARISLAELPLLVPLLHALSEPAVGVGGARAGPVGEEQSWAGLEGVEYSAFREKIRALPEKRRMMLSQMHQCKHLAEGRPLVQTGWLTLVATEDIPEFSAQSGVLLEHLLQSLLFRMREYQKTTDNNQREKNLKAVLVVLQHALEKLQGDRERLADTACVDSLLQCCISIHKSACGMVRLVPGYKAAVTSYQLVLRVAEIQDSILEKAGEEKARERDLLFRRLTDVQRELRMWRDKLLSSTLLTRRGRTKELFYPKELELWDGLLKVECSLQSVSDEWSTTLEKDLRKRISEASAEDKVVLFCLEPVRAAERDAHSTIQRCLWDLCQSGIGTVCQAGKEGDLLAVLSLCPKPIPLPVLSCIIVESVAQFREDPVGSLLDPQSAIHHLLSQGDWQDLQVGQEARQVLQRGHDTLGSLIDALCQGDVLLGRLQTALKRHEQFKKLYRQYKKDSGRKDVPADPERLLSQREGELQAFHQQRELFHTLINMVAKIAEFVTVPEISALEVQHRADVQSGRLSRLVAVRPQGSEEEEEGDCGIARGTVLWYSAGLEALSMAREMHAVRESSLLLSMWVAAAEVAAAPYRGPAHNPAHSPALLSMSLADVQHYLWAPQVTRYRQLGLRIAAASVTFTELEDAFRGSGDRGGAEICRELELMDRALGEFPGLEPGWTVLRFGQIQKYRRLHLAAESAGVVLQVAERLKLTGDFSQIHCLTQLGEDSFRRRPLRSLSDDLVQAGEQLSEVRKQDTTCLEEFLRSQELVSWVKANLQSMSDLKVFVDLASISAGENASEIDRVACFHDAVMGYGPLLYSLPPNSGFEEFMSCARQVFEALRRDNKLPEKLRDSTRLLDWLKGLRETHGSVEQSSLALATAINTQGVYHVGGAETRPGKRCLQSLLLVRVRKDGLDRDHSLEDLLELQNKLMLMSSKGDHGKEQVNRFSQIFEGVQRLGGILLQLHSAGNTLFRGWEAQVHCSPETQPCVRVSFPLPGQLLQLRGEVTEQLQELCRAMERCRGDWAALVADTRSRFPALNLYTAEQAAYLCHALPAAPLPPRAWHLLSPLNPGCSPRDVREALAAATEAGEAEGTREGERGVEEVAAETEGVDGDEDSAGSVDGLWARFRADMPRFLRGHLDIVSLARFLTRLSETNARLVRRALPPGLREGRPNLVLCPAAQTLTAALSFYAVSPAQPPPTVEEVLLCRGETSEEEVDIFLRRALGPAGEGKLFTLLHPGLLAYEVGVALGERFEALGRAAGPRYRLLIVSPVSHQHKYVPSFFSGCKVQAGAGVSAEGVGQYLHRHLAAASQHASVYLGGLSVWVVSSARPAVGKSLYVDRLFERLQRSFPRARRVRLRLTEPRVERDSFLQALSQRVEPLGGGGTILLHLDTTAVRHGLEEFLFELLVLGGFSDSEGKLWRRNSAHLIAVEVLRPRPARTNQSRSEQTNHSLLDVLPTIHCRPPREVKDLALKIRNGQARRTFDPLMDEQEFASEGVQRPYQYLRRYNRRENLDPFKYKEGSVKGDPVDCIHHLLANCGVEDPSWAELRNFSWFLNLQLRDCERSLFCDPDFLAHHLPGFKGFIVKFMVLMARDFATPSLDASDQSPSFLPEDGERGDDLLARLTVRKRWESEPHPYIFFNADHVSMSFLGFHVEPGPRGGTLNAVDPKTRRVVMGDVMSPELLRGLERQGISLSEDFDRLPREDKIQRISFVVGARKGWAKGAFDPDPTYELTADNVMKMLAIHMRFRCGIPVVVMGETGCGKTRLVRFLCDLQREGRPAQNMVLVKVHGGTTAETIRRKVRRAEELAEGNSRQFGLDTVLFFDEANTTEAIFAIKEVICDRTVGGHPLREDVGLKVIAACNPYRRHSPEMIERLERAGLGYRVRSSDTEDRLGRVPLRQLVYRVQPLPPSMVPLVWDFGQLSDSAELSYIRQIVQTQARDRDRGLPASCHKVISSVLAASQAYMRSRKDECSFVSLRDVERSVTVLLWFYRHRDDLFKRCVAREPSSILRCLALAVGVCYYPSLIDKKHYLRAICRHFPEPLNSPEALEREILSCQDVFLENIQTRDTVAKNIALKENVFLMVVCIELRIPLFLVGKPGSSKSLAKTVVADAMQGRSSRCALYRKLKQVHMVSFQCSPHSSPEGIIGTFRQCARFQQGKSLDEYVSVVVLDEVGLAEDSPQMPLKTLHPLLEDGRVDDDAGGDDPGEHMKVGFVGISNWALDPAKMNRGIFVSRWDPSENELVETAKGICSSDTPVLLKIQHLFPKLAKAYLSICRTTDRNQFFGLRDYYSLVKMIFAAVKRSQQEPSESELAEAILRNFSGQPESFDPLQHFRDLFRTLGDVRRPSTLGMIGKNLGRGGEQESRYLLLLTTNNAALHILQQRVFSGEGRVAPEIVFGSGFPKDQEYSQVCRNVNRVKTCMETGRAVVLLNLQNLYESLYDALNQYYVYLGGQQYVDLGLGTHRVKCRVHQSFRLVVVEDQRKVYEQFPVPLINRLEKHRVDRGADLAPWQQRVLRRLEEWVREFARLPGAAAAAAEFEPPDAFVGFHGDACASALLQALERRGRPRGRSGDPHDQEAGLKQEEPMEEGHGDTETNEGMAHGQEASANWSLGDGAEGLVVAESSPVPGEEQESPQREEAEPDVSMDAMADGVDAASAGEPELTAEGGDAADAMEVEEKDDEAEMQESTKSTEGDEEEEVLEAAKSFLLNCATPDAILRLEYSDLGSRERGVLRRVYFHQQHHLSLRDFMQSHLSEAEDPCRFIEVTTFSSLLTQLDVRLLAQALGVATRSLLLLSLHQFDTEASFCSKIRGFLRESDGSAHMLLIQTDAEESLCSDELIASAKYCTMNELRSVEPSPAQCVVVFITKLSRLKGGSQYIGFQGGDAEDMSSDLSALCGTLVSQLLALSVQPEDTSGSAVCVGVGQKGAGPRLHGLSLVRSCVQKAVSLLRDAAAGVSRSLERVQILLGLLGAEQGQPGARFVQVLLGRLVVALAQREELMPSPGEWVSKEATKRQALQEGGTLRHTLWLCLQSTLTPVLAQVLEVLDRDANLDLLCCSGCAADQEINVQRHLVVGGEEQRCAAPFSWLIKMHCQSLWEESEFGPGTREDDTQRVLRFVSSFGSSRLGGHIAKLAGPESAEFARRYLRDFVLLSFRVASEEEEEVFTSAVLGCVSELQRRVAVTSDLSPAWLTAAVTRSALRLDALSHVLQVRPRLSRHLRRPPGSEAPEMREDVLALGACVEEMEQQPVTSLAECESFLRRVELLQPCVERTFGQNYSALCSPGCLQHLEAIRTAWRGMLVVAAFIQQVVLSVKDGRLEVLALKHCTPLQRVMRDSPDLRSKETLHQVIRILNSYHEEFTGLDFRYGTRCPVCLAELVEPAALPCGHLFCLACLRRAVRDASRCPKCRTELPPHFQPSASQELSAALLVDQKLRACCNAFFLEVVSRFCLTEGVGPGEGVVELLFSLLISAQGSVYRTRDLSPLLDCVDDSPVVRSVLPKLLLQYSFEQVKGHIQSYLQSLQDHILDREDETELYRLFVNCFQDSLCVTGGDGSEDAPSERLADDARFLSRLARRQTPGRQDDPAGFLLSMARLRACLGTAAALLQSAVTSQGNTGESGELEARYLEQVKAVCEYRGNDWYRVYLLRAVNRQAGLDCVHALMNSDTWRWAFPPEVIRLQKLVPAEVDYFLCLGGPYRTLRDAVGRAMLESQAHPLQAALQDLGVSASAARILLSLALFRQVTCRLASPNEVLRPRPQEILILEEYLRSSTSGQHRDFCLALLTNQIGGLGSPLHVTPAVPTRRRPLLEILVHAGAVFQNGNGLLSPLHQLASEPGTMAASFLPTMPDDHASEALRLVNPGGQSRIYYCRNRHPCIVGECGRPMQLGRCADCGAHIGGQNHTAVAGFTQATSSIRDQTRTGHVLGAARRRSDAPDRQVSLAEWTVLRLCTHLALLLGAVRHHQGVSAVIHPEVADVWEFLWEHLERDMEVLGRSLGQNVDNTAVTIHLVLQGLLQHATVAGSYQQGADLSSRQGRQRWEKLVCDAVIGPVIQSLESKLGTARQLVAADGQLSGGPLMRLLDGDPSPALPLPSDCPTHSSSFWKLPEPLSVERFSQLLQQSPQRESVPLLSLFMKKVPCVRQLHHLPNLVALLRAFPLATEAESLSIGLVLQQIPAGQRKVLEMRVKIFMEVWNQVRMELATSVEMGVPQALCESELRMDSPGRFLSLCRGGPGSCLSALIRFLSETHNSLVREARRQSRQGDSDYSVPLEVVSETQLALCHPERELLPLVLAHCHYTLRKGEETSSSYDLRGIQVQLTRRFLAGKPLIQEDTSKYLSRQSQDFSMVLAEVRARIPQVPLKGSVRAAMRATLRSFTDACDAALALEVGLRFLGKTGGNPRDPLVPYLRDTLRMEERISSSVAKVLGESRLEHSVSTWQLLTCWKSELRASRGQEPFQKLPKKYRQRLLEEERKAVMVFLRVTDAEAFSWELHEILLLKTSNPSPDDNYPPHWDIRSTLEIHLEQKSSPPLPGLEGLPEELTLEKGADIWRLAVEFKR
ncbi:hypothetical protein MATL_G00000820, partial [Megalops atlanticus]